MESGAEFLAILGFGAVACFLALILIFRTPVIVALVLVPVGAALIGGFSHDIGAFALDGMKAVAPVAVMMTFAILYFGLMIDVGLFEPLVRSLVSLVRGHPVRLCLVTALLPMLVALDGDGATTFLVSVTALLPVHARMGMNPLVLPGIVALSAGVMNMLPWGGPTARAMTVLQADVTQIFLPVIPAMASGIAWVFLAAWFIGLREQRRMRVVDAPASPDGEDRPLQVTPVFWFNASLTVALIALLFRDLYADYIALPTLPPALLFMAAFAIALPINRPTLPAQQEQLTRHAPSVALVISMIFAASVFTGILSGSGMIQAMANAMASGLPAGATPFLAPLVALTGMPLSLALTPDAYYFGVLPALASTAEAAGHDPLAIGRAAILGQMTTGFPLSPLTASTFILVGLTKVSLRDHQRFTFLWALGTTAVMTAVAWMTGALS